MIVFAEGMEGGYEVHETSDRARVHILHEGYGQDRVAATVGLVLDGESVIVTDPGMVAGRSAILDPLHALGLEPGAVTDVVFSHHHPDHTLNAGLFENARFHDHWATYHGDEWVWRDADGFRLSSSVVLRRTPGHTREDISTVVATDGGIVVFTHLWNDAASVGDRHATDLEALHRHRSEVLSFADLVVPGHGPAFVPDSTTPR